MANWMFSFLSKNKLNNIYSYLKNPKFYIFYKLESFRFKVIECYNPSSLKISLNDFKLSTEGLYQIEWTSNINTCLLKKYVKCCRLLMSCCGFLFFVLDINTIVRDTKAHWFKCGWLSCRYRTFTSQIAIPLVGLKSVVNIVQVFKPL